MRRCLLMTCAKAKVPDSGLLPALERYDGLYFRVLRRFLRETPHSKDDLKVLILSAEFGLIPGEQLIPNYDRRITTVRASELRSQVLGSLESQIAYGEFTELFVLLSADYRVAVSGFEAIMPTKTKIIQAKGAQGIKARQLKCWLYGTAPDSASAKLKVPLSLRSPRGHAIIRGLSISLTPAQILERA